VFAVKKQHKGLIIGLGLLIIVYIGALIYSHYKDEATAKQEITKQNTPTTYNADGYFTIKFPCSNIRKSQPLGTNDPDLLSITYSCATTGAHSMLYGAEVEKFLSPQFNIQDEYDRCKDYTDENGVHYSKIYEETRNIDGLGLFHDCVLNNSQTDETSETMKTIKGDSLITIEANADRYNSKGFSDSFEKFFNTLQL
jgi:hypothetical protein